MSLLFAVGFVGSTLSIVSTLPQIYKSMKLNTTGDVSALMYIIRVASSACWCIYGFLLGGTLLVWEAAIVGALQFVMLAFITRDKCHASSDTNT
jgi:uncharacterized protein with PQ loop repeat